MRDGQEIGNDTAEVMRGTVERAFADDPRNWRKIYTAEALATWLRDVALVSAKENVWGCAEQLGERLVIGMGYTTGGGVFAQCHWHGARAAPGDSP